MTAFDEEIRTSIAPLANPLAGAAPAGADLSYDAEFERVAAEIEKLSNLTGGTVDWMLVADDAARMLSERSKDLRLAGWLTVAKAQREGWRGVAEGLFAVQALVDNFWDTMFPPVKRARARAGVLEWLWESLDKALAARAVAASDTDAIKALETLVSDLDARLGERLGDLNPGIGRFRSVVREKVRALPAPPPAPKVEAAPPSPDEAINAANGTNGAGASAGPSPSEEARTAAPRLAAAEAPAVAAPPLPDAPALPAGASLEELHDAASKWQEGLLALARAARAMAPADPWAYRLVRTATWLTIDGVPDHESGRTYVKAPRAPDRSALNDLFEGSHWEGLVEAAEEALTEHIFWLDAHRFSAIGLERLNRQAARDAVGREVVAFAARIAGVEALEFAGGIPFASPETREWLERERARWGGGAASGLATSAPNGGVAALDADVASALAAVRDGSDASIAKLLRAAERGDARSRFVGRLEVAKVALEKERNQLALDVAELLLPDVTDTLEAWEPALAADALANCLRALQTRNREQEAADERENVLFRRLLRLDPEAALRLRSS